MRDPEEVPRLVGHDRGQIEDDAGVGGREPRARRVQLHVGVVDLAGVEVVGDRGEREGVAAALVGPAVVAEDDRVRVAGFLVVLVLVAGDGAAVADADVGRAPAGAGGVHPGRERGVEDLLGGGEIDAAGGVLLQPERDAGRAPGDRDAAAAVLDRGGAGGAGDPVRTGGGAAEGSGAPRGEPEGEESAGGEGEAPARRGAAKASHPGPGAPARSPEWRPRPSPPRGRRAPAATAPCAAAACRRRGST